MKKFISLVCAVEFIENNLRNGINVNDVAVASYLSLSHLQNIFARTFNISIGEYIGKRKLCQAAKDLVETENSVTYIAFDFSYANVESFTRAFKKQFLCTPSAYRKNRRFSELYPRLNISEEEGFDMTHKYDLTQISEKILDSKGTYIICADIDRFILINEKAYSAGDAAIAEAATRIEKSIFEGMDYFRIGADHFIILTYSGNLEFSEEIAQKIISYSEDEVSWSGESFKFTLSMGIVKIPQDIKNAEETIEKCENAMIEAKKEGRNCYKIM